MLPNFEYILKLEAFQKIVLAKNDNKHLVDFVKSEDFDIEYFLEEINSKGSFKNFIFIGLNNYLDEKFLQTDHCIDLENQTYHNEKNELFKIDFIYSLVNNYIDFLFYQLE